MRPKRHPGRTLPVACGVAGSVCALWFGIRVHDWLTLLLAMAAVALFRLAR